MHLKLIAPLCAVLVVTACDFSKPTTLPKVTEGLSVSEHGLKPKETTLLSDDTPVTSNLLLFGRQLGVQFSGVEGFIKKKSAIFPGMSILVTNTSTSDTVYYVPDAYPDESYPNGVKVNPVDLKGWINLAGLIRSGNRYLMEIRLWDKKGKATLNASQEFGVIANPRLKHQQRGVTCNEIYLFDQDERKLIVDTIKWGQQVYFIYEGLKGFKDQDGFYDLQVELLASDQTGRIVFKDLDLTKGELLPKNEVDNVLAPHLKFAKGSAEGPISVEVTISDKNSGAMIHTQTELIVK